MRKKCLINFTTRQLAKRCGVSKSTIHRWLKKMREEKLIAFSQRKKSDNNKYRDMVFYFHIEVLNIMKAMHKRYAYKFIKKKTKIDGTLRIYLYNKYNKLPINFDINQKTPYLLTRNGPEFLNNLDLRYKDLKKPKASDEKIKNALADMISMLSNKRESVPDVDLGW